MGNYAGVDWAAERHDVRVCDEVGAELVAATFAHDEKGLRAVCRTLVRLKVALVAIERRDGLLVERLLDAGLRVLPHASQPGRCVPDAVSGLGRQVRPVRRVRAVRARAHRLPPLPGARARRPASGGNPWPRDRIRAITRSYAVQRRKCQIPSIPNTRELGCWHDAAVRLADTKEGSS